MLSWPPDDDDDDDARDGSSRCSRGRPMMVVVQLGVARGRQVVQRGTVTRPQCTQQFGGCQLGHVLADQTHQQRTVTHTYLPLQHDQRTSDRRQQQTVTHLPPTATRPTSDPCQQQTVATQIVDDESVDVSAVTAVYVSGSGRQVTGPVTAVCIGILLVSRRHAESKKPPRPVGIRPGSEVKRRCVRPPSPFFNSSLHTRVSVQ